MGVALNRHILIEAFIHDGLNPYFCQWDVRNRRVGGEGDMGGVEGNLKERRGG